MIQEWNDEIRKKLLSSLFETNKFQYKRCLEPTHECKRKAIRAHSIQNSRILDNMVVNDHVTAFTRRIDREKGPIIDYGSVGRNQATTFTGLCSEHDNEFFSAIDDESISLSSEKQLFLLAYRAVYRGYHATLEAASKIQSAYQELINMGLEPKDELSEKGVFATQRLIIAWLNYRYKTDFDIAYFEKSYASIHHDSFVYEMDNPTIAVCALFSVDQQMIDGDYLRIALNVLPVTKKQTYVILSYREKDSTHARVALDRVLNADRDHQKYELSRFILNNCENFVLCPIYFNSWSDKKKATIREYYIKTILEGDLNYESPDLYLF
jgi:hypothetical protein